jgi:hypothetical protein
MKQNAKHDALRLLDYFENNELRGYAITYSGSNREFYCKTQGYWKKTLDNYGKVC